MNPGSCNQMRTSCKCLLLMIIFLTRFVGTKQGVLRTYPGLRLQKTYSHRQQSWSVYDCIISKLTGKQRRDNMCVVCQSRESNFNSAWYIQPNKKTNKKHQTPVPHLSFSVGFALRLNISFSYNPCFSLL